MNILTLKVDGSLPGELFFEIQRPAGNPLGVVKTKTKLTIEEIREVPSLLNQLLPQNLIGELSQWVLNGSSPGLLSVISNSLLESIPWECLPQILDLRNVFLVRQFVQSDPLADMPMQNEIRVLAAGWSGKPKFNLPGIQIELAAISQLGTNMDFHTKVLFEQNLTSVAKTCSAFNPNILHLIPASINNEAKEPELVFSGEKQIEYIPVKRFLDSLPGDMRPLLVVLNTCHGGKGGKSPSALHLIAEHLHTIAIGWLGEIDDRTAVDFARFIYARFIEGKTIIDALSAYLKIRSSYGNKEVGACNGGPPISLSWDMHNEVPVVWTPTIELLTKPLIELSLIKQVPTQKPKKQMAPTTRSAESTRVKVEPVISHESSLPSLTIDFSPQKWLNPALLKNGSPAVNNLVITSDAAVRNVGIAISCDAGNGNSKVRQTFNLEKGPQPIPIHTWQFPVLYQLMRTAVPRRQINFTVTCSLAGKLLAETTESVLWMGRTEWLDMSDTWHFLPAFVDPYSEGILDVIGNADNVLKTISGPRSSFVGYDSQNVTEQVEAVFNCLRDKPYELHYIPPPPIPVFTPGNNLSSGQRIRRLDEVVERRRGTCHDLAILFASCLEYIQIFPLIILITGHTFFGFWKTLKAHGEFWKRIEKDDSRRPLAPGREWTITDLKEMENLLNSESIELVDAVTVTDRNAKFEDAVRAAIKYFNDTTVTNPMRKFDVAIDIQASRRKVQPL